MIPIDDFKYYNSKYLPGVMILNAKISSFKFKRHSHDKYAIGLTTSGYHCFYCDGAFHRVPKGVILQINPEEIHDGYSDDKEGYSYYMMYISKKLMFEVINEYFQNKVVDFKLKQTEVFNNELSIKFAKLINEVKYGNENQVYINELFLNVMKLIINNNASLPFSKRITYKDSMIIKAKDFINENLDNNISLDDICEAVNISKYYFIRLFKYTTGITPYQYILDCKVNVVRRELEKGIDGLTIAEKYGFSDLGHLDRRFKEVYGTTPDKFRRSFRLS